jgi:hypothetical protein
MIRYIKLGGLAIPRDGFDLADQLIALSRRTLSRPVTAIAVHDDGSLTGHEVPADGTRLADVARAAESKAAVRPPGRRRPLRKVPT